MTAAATRRTRWHTGPVATSDGDNPPDGNISSDDNPDHDASAGRATPQRLGLGEVDRTPQRGSAQHGMFVIRANLVGTAFFVVTAVFAAAVFTTPAQWVGAVSAMSLFTIGVVAFLWGFWNAVQRSRDEEVSVTQLFLLFGAATPSSVRRPMLAALAVQVVAAFVTTFWRLDGPDGTPGSSLAVGMLVPMFGLGMNGLWAAYHADFEERRLVVPLGTTQDHDDVAEHDGGTKSAPIDKNDAHG